MSGIIPIFVVRGDRLRLSSEWRMAVLEQIIGEPRHYATRTVQLLVVVPELSIATLNVDELKAKFEQYAPERDLEVLLTYHVNRSSRPTTEFVNPRERSTYQLRLTLVTSETIAAWKADGLVPFDEMLGSVGLRYGGINWIHPGDSVEIDQILAGGGTLFPGRNLIPGIFPYTHVKVYLSEPTVNDRLLFPIRRP